MSFKNLLEQKPDYLVCVCMGVMYSEIVTSIACGDRTFKALQDSLMIGMGCSSCHEEVKTLIAEVIEKSR